MQFRCVIWDCLLCHRNYFLWWLRKHKCKQSWCRNMCWKMNPSSHALLKVRCRHRISSKSCFFYYQREIFVLVIPFFKKENNHLNPTAESNVLYVCQISSLTPPWYCPSPFRHLLPTNSGYSLNVHETRWTTCIYRMI